MLIDFLLFEEMDQRNDAGRPSTSVNDENIEAMNKMLGSCQAIFRDNLGIKCAAAKIVPKLLNFEQKQRRMGSTQEMLTTLNDYSDLLNKLINGDKSRMHGYDIETKSPWKHPEEPRPKKKHVNFGQM